MRIFSSLTKALEPHWTWFYRVQGTATQIDIRHTRTVNYNLVNTSTTNPIIYEVVYQAGNGNCPAADVVIPITVYRAITAGFNEGVVPPFIGGNSTVTVTNTSTPIYVTQFRYEWTFGLNSTPATGLGAGPFVVDYSSPGPRDISLKVVNIAVRLHSWVVKVHLQKQLTFSFFHWLPTLWRLVPGMFPIRYNHYPEHING